MVLQRDVKVPVWGWAAKGEKVNITFAGKKYSAVPDATGKWVIYLAPLAVGGPYEMVIKGKNELTLKNILMGEVWLCSGQSNMEMPLAGWGRIKTFRKKFLKLNIQISGYLLFHNVCLRNLSKILKMEDGKNVTQQPLRTFQHQLIFLEGTCTVN